MTEVFIKLFNMSITAGWIILAVILLRLLLRRAPKIIRYLLWALVALRLLIPVSFESPVSLIPSTDTVPPSILYENTPSIHSGISSINSAVNPVLGEALSVPAESVSGGSITPAASLISVLTVIWLTGVAVMAIYSITSYVILRFRVRPSAKLRDGLWISDSIPSPFILGIIKPRIYMPSDITDTQADAVEAHERMHIRHGDHIWKMVGFTILSVYWWNPLVWAAYILFCRDIELICDENVVKKMEPSQRREYSEALLSFNMPRRFISACPLAFGEVGVKARIKSVLNYKKPGLWIIIIAIIACTATAVFFMTDPVEEDPFKYDRFTVEVTYADPTNEKVTKIDSNELHVGDIYTLPGYGENASDITLTVESLNRNGKTALLKLSHPLDQVGTNGSSTDTVRLMMDHHVFEGIGFDSVTLASPGGEKLYKFSHVRAIADKDTSATEEKEETSPSEKTQDGLLPSPAVFKEKDTFVSMYGRSYLYNGSDMTVLELYNAFDTGSFKYVSSEVSAEYHNRLSSMSSIVPSYYGDDGTTVYVTFRNSKNAIGTFRIGENEGVTFTEPTDDGYIHFFTAAKGTYKRVSDLVERIFRNEDKDDTSTLGNTVLSYSTDAGCYILSSYRTSYGIPSVDSVICCYIYADMDGYTLSYTADDDGKIMLAANHDGKTYLYREKDHKLVGDEGSPAIYLLGRASREGMIDGESRNCVASIDYSPFPGKFSFTLTVRDSSLREHKTAFLPKEVCEIRIITDDKGRLHLLTEIDGKEYKAEICIEDGNAVLKGSADFFGDPHFEIKTNGAPDDYHALFFKDVDNDKKQDHVYIHEGPLFGRYSVSVTAVCQKHTYSSSFAYNSPMEFSFEKDKSDRYVVAEDENGVRSRYAVSVDNRSFRVVLTPLEESTPVLEELGPDPALHYYGSALYSSVYADVDGDGTDEVVSVGPGMHSGLSSFSVIISSEGSAFGPISFVSDSISQIPVKDNDGNAYIRVEYTDKVILYQVKRSPDGKSFIISDKDGNGIK